MGADLKTFHKDLTPPPYIIQANIYNAIKDCTSQMKLFYFDCHDYEIALIISLTS